MPLTLDEITEHENRAHREIAERECLLAALKVLRGYTAPGAAPAPMEAPLLLSGLIPFTSEAAWKELRASPPAELAPAPSAPAEPAPPAQLPQPPRYIHPDLAAIGSGHGSINQAVVWAIQRMTDDYTARDLDELPHPGRPSTGRGRHFTGPDPHEGTGRD